jgi:hypothetical protein
MAVKDQNGSRKVALFLNAKVSYANITGMNIMALADLK